MSDRIKKYCLYCLIVIIGCILKNVFNFLNTYSFGFLVGGIAVIPLWKDYYTNYK